MKHASTVKEGTHSRAEEESDGEISNELDLVVEDGSGEFEESQADERGLRERRGTAEAKDLPFELHRERGKWLMGGLLEV